MNTLRHNQCSRRDFLTQGAIGTGTVLCGGLPVTAGKKKTPDPYGGFKMGIQSYSLRGYRNLNTALRHTRELGLHYWESYPGHIPISTRAADIKRVNAALSNADVKLIAYGVVGFNGNEKQARKAFDFAKTMGIVSLSANPKKDNKTFDLLDKLVDEYGIAIAIHNHGPGALYDKIDDVVRMVKNRHPKIGACVDTGHFLRSDEDPVEAIGRLGKRVFGVHVKDVKTIVKDGKRTKHFTVVGKGDLDVVGMLRVLKKLNYDYALSLEYEEHPKDPLPEIAACLKAVRAAVRKLG